MNQQDAVHTNDGALPTLAANATPDDIQLWLAATRTHAHRLIDESVTAAQEALNKRSSALDEGDATAQAQRHAQRLAVERLRRAIGDLTLEIRGVHGRLDRLEALVRAAVETPAAVAPAAASHPAAPSLTAREFSAPPESVSTPELNATTNAPASEAAPNTAAHAEIASDGVRPPAETLATTIDLPTEPAVAPALSITPDAPGAQPVAGFAADARAAVEAAVASALQEARRAAAGRQQPSTEPAENDEASPQARSVTPEASPAPSDERRTPEAAPASTWPRLAQAEPLAAEPIALEPRASEPAAPIVTTAAAELAPAEAVPERAPQTQQRGGEPASPAARPSLWVPPSAIAPPRAVERPSEAPASEPEPIRDTPASESFPRPAATTLAAAQAPAPQPVTTVAPATTPASVRPTPVSPAAMEGRFAAVAATVERATTPGTFEPGDGPVVLRIAPISGFQGLMRVQDAVVQHAPVREATVEAYARGEARLRLQLVSALDAEQLASTLVRSLGLQARVESVSDEERSIQVTLA